VRVTHGANFAILSERGCTGHGIGKVLVPLVLRREARKEMPGNLAALKSRLQVGWGRFHIADEEPTAGAAARTDAPTPAARVLRPPQRHR
jgi:hypothetical protein